MGRTASKPFLPLLFTFPFPFVWLLVACESRCPFATANAYLSIFPWRVAWCTRIDFGIPELSADTFVPLPLQLPPPTPPPEPPPQPRPRRRERLPPLAPTAAVAASSSKEWGMS